MNSTARRRCCSERHRVEGEDHVSQWSATSVEDPIQTLSALARPGKALALEAQIELWSASSAAVPLFSFSRRHRVMRKATRMHGNAGLHTLPNGTMAGCSTLLFSQRPARGAC